MNNIKKNVIWNTLGLTLNSFNSLFFLVIVNRVNGVEMAGVFSFAFSIACLLYIIGIYAGRTFQVSDAKQELSDKEYLMHKYITCAVMLAFGIVFVILQKYSQQKNTVIILLCIYKCLEAFDDTLYGYLQKNEQLHIVGKSLFFKSIVGIVVFWGIDLISRNLIIACCALIINSLCFVIFYDIKKSISDEKKSEDNNLPEVNNSTDDANDGEKFLRDHGVDMDNALSLLGDIEMYNDTLKDYLSEVDDKFVELKGYKEQNDMKNYAILVHSMKSDAKYLGLMDFADVAYEHELKSKEGDSSFVNDNFSRLEDELNKALAIVKEYAKNI